MSDDSSEEVKAVVIRLSARQHAAYMQRAATIDRPMAWWIRAVLDRAIADHVGDPRQALLPFDGGPGAMPRDADPVARRARVSAAGTAKQRANASRKAKAKRGGK